ncbi:chromosome segregation protein SMC [Mangrovivirga cuniculi]|uniref:Chromosome partition protein Smc n=1 Tax=Mangrovivirga cuniculi TaxID=2715131 RepID=A0A4D7JQJ3_9BACT|nr:chromosome segregation protein SMC [Mangrovivirga cuniculi]QCK15052.1 chromosome segregation protein SMC [Mangrovivirga cuniculi]
MQLSKLEIKGFKSFGDRIVINFDEGITGIVGPNGCGKSNVVDAIRWVLGEQRTRNLRSDKMENVIFNGTKKRKAAGMAEVSMTFNNTKNLLPTEYSQVTITRRYYRSGESEYLLNGVTCRLKDITSLFLDTGISSNSYAIIELKMVDDILNDKDNARRDLFEEAAGVSKFKIRKKETLRKLQGTDDDLNRVEDLLFEIDKNLKSLERQAKQAEKYYNFKKEYKDLSIELAVKSVSEQKANINNIEKRLEEENDKKVAISKQVKEKEAEIEKLKADIIGKEKLLSSRQKSLNNYVAKIRQYESENKIKNERMRFLTDKTDKLREQIDHDKKSNERAAFSIKSLNEEKSVVEKNVTEATAYVEELKAAYEEQKSETAIIQEKVSALNKTLREKQNNVYQIKKELEIKEIQVNSFQQELEKTADETSEKTANIEQFAEKLNELSDYLNEKKDNLAQKQAKEEQLQQRLEAVKKTIEVIKEEMHQTNRKLDAKQNEYNLTKSLVDNLEGFPEAIKFLKKHKNWKTDAPLLSDVLTTDEKYRVTIENFLEPYMNYYIVNDYAEAYKAINLLSEASKGKAHFFILDSFEKKKNTEHKFFDKAFPATEVIEYDEKYRKLVSHVLDNVYIVDGDESDIPNDPDCIFITISGKITRRVNSITGGSVGLFEGKRIGRAKNLEKLQEQIETFSKKIHQVNKSLEENQKELHKLLESSEKEEIEELKQQIAQINEEYVSLKTKHEQFSEMLSSNANRREDIQEKITEYREDLETLRPKVSEEEAVLNETEEQIAILSDQLEEKNELLSEKSAAYNDENIKFHQIQNKLNSIEQEISFKESAHESSKIRIEKNQEELKETEDEVKGLLDRSEHAEDELIEMYQEKEQIEAGVNEAEREYYAARGNVDEYEKSLKEFHHRKEDVDTLVMELKSSLNDAKLNLTSIKERLSVEFEVDLDSLLRKSSEELPDSGMDEEELRTRVHKIKDKMDRIGPINPMAMEAYQEIKERHDFITQQRDDLIEAKESLLETISEIDTVARESFLESFEMIKENFLKVFRSLFTVEDDCDLKLVDPDNPLDSKIEIMAKPKGKRPLTINQLSGGEKTLTATSLLFAIYLLKPAPFCIFDEVDAPLDDANIDKFNNIIKTFSKDSQFIIVTHNKRTMASTDIIYGITMIEQGVSRVVPVDLRELQNELGI